QAARARHVHGSDDRHARAASVVQHFRCSRAQLRRFADAVISRDADAAGALRRRQLPADAERKPMSRIRIAALMCAILAASLQAQVSFDRVLHADREPQNWLSYSATPFNQRYSGLAQVTVANVKNL